MFCSCGCHCVDSACTRMLSTAGALYAGLVCSGVVHVALAVVQRKYLSEDDVDCWVMCASRDTPMYGMAGVAEAV
jgi:hypothetical protein